MGSDEAAGRHKPGTGYYDDLPAAGVTINQIVAYNLAYWRKAAGLTQEELGKRLGGWSKNAISAAERSWDGRRVRQFDADELVAMATALGVPLQALFLPPDDDGVGCRYVYRNQGDEWAMPMTDLFAVVGPDSLRHDSAFRERLAALVGRYMDARWGGVASDIAALFEVELRATQLERLRWQREALQALVGDLDAFIRGLWRAQEEGQ